MKQIMVIMLVGLVSSVYATDIYVSLTGDGGDGLSWSTAFTNVQSAINHATAGDTIHVQGGTYLLSQDIVWANKNNLSVQGSYEGSGTPGNSDPSRWPTMLKRQDGNICRILSVTNVVGAALSNVTVTGGFASNLVSSAHSMGGGLYVLKSTGVTIGNCTITNNYSGQYQASSGGRYAYGGGVCIDGSAVVISDSLIGENKAASEARSVYCQSMGGGIASLNSSSVILSNSVVRCNGSVKATNGGYPCAGGIFSETGTFQIENCLIYGNNACDEYGKKYAGHGDGLYGNSFTVKNSTLAFNMGEGVYQVNSEGSKRSTFTDCILWGNGNDIAGSSGNVTLDHCDVGLFDGDTGTDCLHSDPLFDRGFYLGAGSPCVDAGSETASAAGLGTRTTRADGTLDSGMVNLGFHETGGTDIVAADFYVSASGSDTTGDGSAGSPYRSITKALTELPDWSTLHIGAGSYTAASGEVFPYVLDNRRGLSFVGASADSVVLDNERVEGNRILEISNCLNVAFSGLTLTGALPTKTVSASLYGGAVSVVFSGGIEFHDCIIRDNVAWHKHLTHGVYTFGGGIASCGTSLQVEQCKIQNNIVSNYSRTGWSSWGCGGGVAVLGGQANLVNCKIIGNLANTSGNGNRSRGGGVYNNGGTTWIYDSLIVSNSAYVKETNVAGCGDGVCNNDNDNFSYLVMENCTLADNGEGTHTTGIYNAQGGYPRVVDLLNCIVVGHTDDVFNGQTISVSYSCIGTEDTFWTDGVNGCLLWSTGEPLFKWNTVGDYRLADNAVAKNVGTTRYWMDDILDMGGNPRVAFRVVDMGCYENAPPSGSVLSIR